MLGKLGDIAGIPCQLTNGKQGAVGLPRAVEGNSSVSGSDWDYTNQAPRPGVGSSVIVCVGPDNWASNNTQGTASDVSPYLYAGDTLKNLSLTGTLDPNGDEDWYSLPSRKIEDYVGAAGNIRFYVSSGPDDVAMDVYRDGSRVASNVQLYPVPDTNAHTWLIRVYGTGPASYRVAFGD